MDISAQKKEHLKSLQEYGNKMFILFCLSTAVALIFLFVPLIQFDLVIVQKSFSWLDFIPGIGELSNFPDDPQWGDIVGSYIKYTLIFMLLLIQILFLLISISAIFNKLAQGSSGKYDGFYGRLIAQLFFQILIAVFGFFWMFSLIGDASNSINIFNIGDFFSIVRPWFLIPTALQIILCIIADSISKAFKQTDAWKLKEALAMAQTFDRNSLNDLSPGTKKQFEKMRKNAGFGDDESAKQTLAKRIQEGTFTNPYIIDLLEKGIAPSDFSKYLNEINDADATEATPSTPQSGDQDTIALLKQYKQLLDDGILTEEEFQAKKEELLHKGK